MRAYSPVLTSLTPLAHTTPQCSADSDCRSLPVAAKFEAVTDL